MRYKRIKFNLSFGVIILFVFISSACQKTQEATENKTIAAETPKPTQTVSVKSSQQTPVDIAKLADRSAFEVAKILGEPIETKEITVPKKGEYRFYEIAGEPKGLAIRFYDGRAKNFNLILTEPAATAREALKRTFAIDVGNKPPTKDKQEPLSEKWSGSFGGVKFSSVYAKRESEKGGFVFVLAEIAE